MNDFELFCNRIVPVPKQVQQLEGKALKLSRTTRFRLTAPTAEFGPVMTAGERVRALLTAHCGEGCFADDGLPVMLSLGEAPFEITCADQGYRLRIAESGIEITGFGEAGLLYGVITLEQLNVRDILSETSFWLR